MLHWQLKKWLRNFSLKTKITCISLVGHLCILFSLFVLYRGNEQYHILITGTMINTDVPIVFLPMHKTLMQTGGQKKSAIENSSSKSTVETVAPIKKGTVAVALSERKKAAKKAKAKKEAKKKGKKAEPEKKIEPKKIVEEKPKPIEPEKAIEIPKQEQIIPTENPITATPVAGADDPNILYVGQQEMDALQMQEYIHQEMAQHWSPPAGMRKDISCIIKVLIAFDGAVSTIEVEQTSGVFIFDGAAKRAAAQLTPPQWAYGKEILLTFKP